MGYFMVPFFLVDIINMCCFALDLNMGNLTPTLWKSQNNGDDETGVFNTKDGFWGRSFFFSGAQILISR